MSMPSNDALRSLIAQGGQLELPYFDGASAVIEPPEFESPDLVPALTHFLRLTPEHRLGHSRHVFAYHQLMVHECGNPLTDPPHPVEPEQIWVHGHPESISFTYFEESGTPSPSKIVVVVNCAASWESHGVSLFFDYGKDLCKVADPQSDPSVSKPGRIFDCYREEFCTYRDE